MGKVSDYLPLSQHLQRQASLGITEVTISFADIENIIKRSLPPTATSPRSYQAWWANSHTEKSRQCSAWLDYGWIKEKVDLDNKLVTFRHEGRK